MDIFWFRDLARLQQTGNFTLAARLSNLSQPAFSRRIKSLEAWVGVPLVNRSQQPVQLTQAGAQILEAGQQALTQIETERSHILEAQSLPDKYVITFAAQHSIAWRFYPAWLQAFEDDYGPILSRLRADELPVCVQDLHAGVVDFVIAYATQQDRDFTESLLIGGDSLIPVCKPDTAGRPLFDFGVEQIEMPFLRYGPDAPISAPMEPVFAREGLHPRLRVVYENSMSAALRIRARDGMGVAWLPKSLVVPDLKQGVLVRTGLPEWEVPLEIRLCANPDRSNHITRSIWTYLKDRDGDLLVPVE